MVRITQVEEIAGLLLLLPALVQEGERHSPTFVTSVGSWLNSLEKAFTHSRLYQAGNIAMLRSALIAATRGQVPSEIAFRGRPSRSQVVKIVATHTLQRAAEVASNLMTENQPRLTEAERIAQQIVAAASSRGLIVAPDSGANHTQYLRTVRHSFISSSDLEIAAVHLEGLVGPTDALIVLDRALAAQPAAGSS